MLKKIILDYVESIEALRDFVDSVKLRLEEHVNRSLSDGEEPYFSERMEKLQSVFGGMEKARRDALFRRPLSEIESDAEFKQLLGFEFTLQMTQDYKGKKSLEFAFPLNIEEASESAQQLYSKTEKQKELLYKSSLINLTSTVELFLSQLLHFYFDRFPDAVGSETKFFSLDDLKSLGSIEDAKKHLIESKVEAVLRESLEEWLRFWKERVKLSMGYVDTVRDQLIEVYQRRNLLIHNGGRVNSIYLSKVAPGLRENMSRDQLLSVKPEYLNKTLDLFELNFVLIAAELWKRLDPKDEERPDTLTGIVYTHLLNERWDIAEGLSYFQMNDRQTSEKSQIYGQLNYWQSVKWQDRFEKVRQEVEQADFSAKDPLYQLALLALQNKTNAFLSLLPIVLRSGKLTIEDFNNWPIFREMRKAEAIRSFLKNEHNETIPAAEERSASLH